MASGRRSSGSIRWRLRSVLTHCRALAPIQRAAPEPPRNHEPDAGNLRNGASPPASERWRPRRRERCGLASGRLAPDVEADAPRASRGPAKPARARRLSRESEPEPRPSRAHHHLHACSRRAPDRTGRSARTRGATQPVLGASNSPRRATGTAEARQSRGPARP
jgi:hypothetical protein